MTQDKRDYASYLLRLWRSGEADPPAWRASLQSTQDGHRLNFPDLEALVDFLRAHYDSLQPDPFHEARDEAVARAGAVQSLHQ